MTGFIVPKADWLCLWNGKDITNKIDPQLIELSLVEKSGGEADELQLTIIDKDGQTQIPKKGDIISVKIGFTQGTNVPIGLIDKGNFKIDEFPEISGPPDIITIAAKSVEFGAGAQIRKPQNHVGKTLGTILNEIANRLGIKASIDEAFKNIIVPAIVKMAKSDLALLRELGRKYDAIATIKNDTLIFMSHGAKATPKGKPLKSIIIDRADAPKFKYSESAHEETSGTETKYHDRKTATTSKITHEGKDKSKPKHKLRKIHANAHDANAAAKSHTEKKTRSTKSLDLELGVARPDLFPNINVNVTGYKAEINGTNWNIKEITHKMGATGLSTSLVMQKI